MSPSLLRWAAGSRLQVFGRDDTLAPFRGSIALSLSLVSILLLAPFTVNHLWDGRIALGGVIAAAQAALIANTVALRRGRPVPIPFALMCAMMAAAVCYSVHAQPSNGAYWAYPTLFISYFLMPRHQALVLSAGLAAGVSVLLAYGTGIPVALRAGTTLLLTLVMIHVVLNVISKLQTELQAQAVTDPLTGAFNRRHLDATLASAPPRLERRVPCRADDCDAILAIDIDHFKTINDRHGHPVGDEVLIGVVQALRERLRPGDRLFRIGGEEFVLLAPRTPVADAQRLGDRLRTELKALPMAGERALRITISIGVAAEPPSGTPSDWLRRADEALYEAKRLGRDRVVVAA